MIDTYENDIYKSFLEVTRKEQERLSLLKEQIVIGLTERKRLSKEKNVEARQ